MAKTDTTKDRTLKAEDLLKNARGVSTDSKTFREILHDEFKGTSLVTIKNILDVDFGYVYTDPEEENVEQPDTATKRVYFGEPKARVLKADEKVTIQGWEAYIALGKMWKEFAIAGGNFGVTITSNQAMREFIEKAYLGIFDPNNVATAPSAPAKTKDTATKSDDLGFSE